MYFLYQAETRKHFHLARYAIGWFDFLGPVSQ